MKQFSKENFYTITELCKVLKASHPTVKKRVDENLIPYDESPITGRKYFDKLLIEKLFLNANANN